MADDTFDLYSVEYSEERRAAFVRYRGDLHEIAFKRIAESSDIPGGIWLVPGDQVARVFGNSCSHYMCAFIGNLVEACHAANAELPVLNVDMNGIEEVAVNRSSFSDLIFSIVAGQSYPLG
jgi:hypothetical protein